VQFKKLLVDWQWFFRPLAALPNDALISYIDPPNQMKNNLTPTLGVAGGE
jgi:hypothetical protein